MTILDTFKKFSAILKNRGIDYAENETRLLICHLLGISSPHFYAHTDRVLTGDELAQLENMVKRRLNGEPVAYITGHCEFYGIDLYVDRRVFIPRPETEILVEGALSVGRKIKKSMVIVDVGTGSGAIAIAIAMNLPKAFIYAVDVSSDALEVAWNNVCRYGLQERVNLIRGNLMDSLTVAADIVVANLPYISEKEMNKLPVEICRNEPEIALKGGVTGTELIEKLIKQLPDHLKNGGVALLEIGYGHDKAILKIIKGTFPSAQVYYCKDFSGIKRAVKITFSSFDNDIQLM